LVIIPRRAQRRIEPATPAAPPPVMVARERPVTASLAVGALSPLSPGKTSEAPGPGSPGGPPPLTPGVVRFGRTMPSARVGLR